MAACTAYTSIVVSNAGTAAINGIYIPYSTAIRGSGSKAGQSFTIWTKDGLNSFPKITVSGSGDGQWAIQYTIPYPGAEAYITNTDSFGTSDCPVGFVWSTVSGAPDAPTVTGVTQSSEPTFGLPAETVALITSRFGTVARFLRLRNQGQV